jgi:hypothetical protein
MQTWGGSLDEVADATRVKYGFFGRSGNVSSNRHITMLF